MKLKAYTVISIDNDTDQVYADWSTAKDEWEAFARISKKRSNVTLVGAIKGGVQVTAPCEESVKVCDISDYPGGKQ